MSRRSHAQLLLPDCRDAVSHRLRLLRSGSAAASAAAASSPMPCSLRDLLPRFFPLLPPPELHALSKPHADVKSAAGPTLKVQESIIRGSCVGRWPSVGQMGTLQAG